MLEGKFYAKYANIIPYSRDEVEVEFRCDDSSIVEQIPFENYIDTMGESELIEALINKVGAQKILDHISETDASEYYGFESK